MIRITLFLWLYLLTSACQKHSPTPAPTLEGTWLATFTETNQYTADGILLSQSGLVAVPNSDLYKFTTTTLTVTPFVITYNYTREGDALTLRPTDPSLTIPFIRTIVTLTQTDLVLQDKRASTQGTGYTISLMHLVRRS
ncbi:hypothetical protein [Hymenobacter jejuensis]|uniref:Lipocalin-like domain-containing protein n=1 Tax=Hymenobacter jejuensis TaxID=2502781 RepID=A0A5B8A1Y1_9BACT|nr:hypothetical protein [Hymenobacter jejuensis]QDA60675.1 hypothetical protein FHG12_11430 [Hymenobacter jejuensis]